jgi:hypothetical protein
MMYREQYVAVVMRNGKIQPEDQSGVIVLPFESEYQIRLKNKSRKRAVADIHIDGRLAVRGVVVEPLGAIDLERFLEGFSLDCGPRFKLVKASDSRVSQPGDSENGIINVNFYAEKDQPKVVEEHKIIHHEHGHNCYHGHCRDCCTWCRPITFRSGGINSFTTYGSTLSAGGTTSMAFNANSNITPTGGVDMNVVSKSADVPVGAPCSDVFLANASAEPAATVEGSHSTQQFQMTHIDVDRDHPVTIQLKLKGVIQAAQECGCGFKRGHDEKFCPQCGKQLVVVAA